MFFASRAERVCMSIATVGDLVSALSATRNHAPHKGTDVKQTIVSQTDRMVKAIDGLKGQNERWHDEQRRAERNAPRIILGDV